MKKLLIFPAVFMLCLPLAFSFQSSEYYDDSIARMSYVNGDVFVQRASDMGYEEGAVNLPLVENDKLGTRDGRAEIHFGRKNYIRIDRYTHLDLAKLPRQGDDQVRLHLLSGNAYLRVSFLEREKDFEIHTPDASFYILEEGLYELRVTEHNRTEARVLAGTMEAAGEEGSVLVNREEKLIAVNGVFPSGPEYASARDVDSFADWNRSRDALLQRSVQKAYLPPELNAYEEELAYNGNWVYESPYGYVWVPTVYHHTWRPYYYGRWSWHVSFGWCWVPSEPWGWCVSHYGRWHWRFGLGWYWIPSRGWGPAWVHWYCGSSYIGWCPISYYGYPVVIVNNRFYGRHYGDHYPLHSRALTVVHKNQLQSRRISKVALSQNSVNRLGKVSLASRQPSAKFATQRDGVRNATAAKVLARSNIRKVNQSYKGSPAVRSTHKAQATRIEGMTKRSSNLEALRSPTSSRSKTGSFSKTSRTRESLSIQGTKSPGRTSLSSSSRGQARGAIKTYPSRQVALGRSSSYRRSTEGTSFSGDYRRGGTSVKYYQSRDDINRGERVRSPYSSSYQAQRGKTYRSSTRSSSVERYPSRQSRSSSRFEGMESYTRRYRSTDRYNYQTVRSSTGQSSRSFGYKSSSRYSPSGRSTRYYSQRSPSGLSGRSYSRGKVSSSRGSFRGSYSSPSRTSRSYSQSRSSRSSSKSYSRARVSSSRSSPSRSSRSSSRSRTSRSSSKSTRRK